MLVSTMSPGRTAKHRLTHFVRLIAELGVEAMCLGGDAARASENEQYHPNTFQHLHGRSSCKS